MSDKKTARQQFMEEMGDVRPIKPQQRAEVGKKNRLTPGHEVRREAAVTFGKLEQNPLTDSEHIEMLGPDDPLDYKKDGVQHGVYKKLRLGKYMIEARLDLHKHTVEQARREVFRFINDCMRYSLRTVLITHGKGERNPDQLAIIKSYLNKWLSDLDEVMAFHSAQRQHGGTGAVYLLLKKNEEERQRNREKHGLK
ncbi:MAG: DNA endonuclease SmrA [Proteobacteria bacterium]|nr:MAG: DNA endonuclease SmrA [Pseudomonadota bacterium]PIE40397.1 MAG: DNA endonuclease SmrA [Gammaproteobacteria bacterium]